MPEQWLSVAEAAAHLKVHPRTIERRIASRKIDSRRGDNGFVQVKIDMPEDPPQMVDPFETVRELADRQVDIAAGSATTIVRFAQEAAERATRELAVARQERDVARKQSKVAWISSSSIAAASIVLLGLVVLWAMRSSASAAADVSVVKQRIDDERKIAESALTAKQLAEQRAEAALRAQALAEGKLDAYQQQARELQERQLKLARGRSQPSLVDRLATLFATE